MQQEPLARRRPAVAIAHDYLAIMGGAERVVANMLDAFPNAPLYTSIYAPEHLYDNFAEGRDRHTTWLSRIGFFRDHYRLSMPFLAATMRRFVVDADVVLCSSSGWSHGVRTTGRKVVYCHNPARWLYQTDEYTSGRKKVLAVGANIMKPYLQRFDRKSADSCVRYLANSRVVAERIKATYDIDAEVLPPPSSLVPGGEQTSIASIAPGFLLCVARLLPYKNVDAIISAMKLLPDHRLVVVGIGPMHEQLQAQAGPNVRLFGRATDGELRWLYATCAMLIAASHEDFGLTPVEAGMFGKPTACLRYGGYLDTMVEGETGLFFDDLTASTISNVVRRVLAIEWDAARIDRHAQRFSEVGFHSRLREIIAEELVRASGREPSRGVLVLDEEPAEVASESER